LSRLARHASEPRSHYRVARTVTDTPGVFLREVGASRIVYFPWDIDRTFWEVLAQLPQFGE
jgi:hypothetical protein